MKTLYEYINESTASRDAFIEKVRTTMDKAIANKSMDAWFFNSADLDRAERTSAEKYISSILPGKYAILLLKNLF